MSLPHEERNKRLEAWTTVVLCALVALAVTAGLLLPIVRRSPYVGEWRFIGGVLLSGLATAWCYLDSRIQRYDMDDRPRELVHLLYWLPVIGVFYYLVLSRRGRDRPWALIKAGLFMALLAVFFETARRYSMIPF